MKQTIAVRILAVVYSLLGVMMLPVGIAAIGISLFDPQKDAITIVLTGFVILLMLGLGIGFLVLGVGIWKMNLRVYRFAQAFHIFMIIGGVLTLYTQDQQATNQFIFLLFNIIAIIILFSCRALFTRIQLQQEIYQ